MKNVQNLFGIKDLEPGTKWIVLVEIRSKFLVLVQASLLSNIKEISTSNIKFQESLVEFSFLYKSLTSIFLISGSE